MSILKQRVALGRVQGSDVYITLEWLKDLNTALGGTETTDGGTDLSALESLVASLTTDLAALTARVVALEGGYQV